MGQQSGEFPSQGEFGNTGNGEVGDLLRAAVRSEVARILASSIFSRSKRSARLLRFLVERTLEGQAESLKEFVIAVEALDRDQTFDPRIDSLVRVEVSRLRSRLKAYYEESSPGGVRIELHPGGYAPVFVKPGTDLAQNELAQQSAKAASSPLRLWLAASAIAVGLVLAGFWVFAGRLGPPKEIRVLNGHRLTAYSGITAYGALGPGSKWIVCASDRGDAQHLHLWRYPIEGGEPLQLTSGPQNDTAPAVSPDGKWIAFESTRKPAGIYLIPSAGGDQRRVAPSGMGPRFSPDGKWLAYWVVDPHSTFGKVFVAPVGSAGEPIGIAREFDDAHAPVWAPDGRGLLICGTRQTRGGPAEEHDIWFVPLTGRGAIRTGALATLARAGVNPHANLMGRSSFHWLDEGLVFPGSSNGRVGLWWLPLSTRSWRAGGDPVSLALTTDQQVHPSLLGGTLAFTIASVMTNVWSVPLAADEARATGEPRRLIDGAFDHLSPSISLGGETLVFLSARHGPRLLAAKKDLSGASETILSAPGQTTNRLKISADGRTAYYRVLEGPEPQLQAIYSADLATGRSTRVCPDCGAPTHVSPDGRLVIFETGSTPTRLAAVKVDTGQKWEFASHPHHSLNSARVSPDGRWMAFHLDRGWDGKQIFVAPFHDAAPIRESEWIPVTEAGAVSQEAWWSPNGRYVYYLSDHEGWRCIWAQELDSKSRKPIGPPLAIHHFHQARLTPLSFIWRSPQYVGLSVAPGHLVLSLTEISSNIWVGDLQR